MASLQIYLPSTPVPMANVSPQYLKICALLQLFVAAHDVYYYLFGQYQTFRIIHSTYLKKKSNIILLNKREHGSNSAVQSSLKMLNRDDFKYQLTHKWSAHLPYCIYAMVHENTEAASKAKIDQFKWPSGENSWEHVLTTKILKNVKTPWPTRYDPLAVKFQEAIKLYSLVVPKALLIDIEKVLEAQIPLIDKIDVAKGANEVKSIQLTLMQENQKLQRKLVDINEKYSKEVKKENQRNEFCYDHLQDILRQFGYVSKPSIDHCNIRTYGKSLLDLYFYKQGGAVVSSAVIKKFDNDLDVDHSNNAGVVGGVAEFKITGNLKTYYAQTFADMVRVGVLLAHDALMRGAIIDKLIVFGLLINYDTGWAIVMKYYVNFIEEETTFLVERKWMQ